jgi:hypothetical protein
MLRIRDSTLNENIVDFVDATITQCKIERTKKMVIYMKTNGQWRYQMYNQLDENNFNVDIAGLINLSNLSVIWYVRFDETNTNFCVIYKETSSTEIKISLFEENKTLVISQSILIPNNQFLKIELLYDSKIIISNYRNSLNENKIYLRDLNENVDISQTIEFPNLNSEGLIVKKAIWFNNVVILITSGVNIKRIYVIYKKVLFFKDFEDINYLEYFYNININKKVSNQLTNIQILNKFIGISKSDEKEITDVLIKGNFDTDETDLSFIRNYETFMIYFDKFNNKLTDEVTDNLIGTHFENIFQII